MKNTKNALLIPILFAFLLSFSTGCSNNKTENTSSASWTYPFVVWDGYTYNTINEYVDVDKIDKEIGAVTVYSDKEGNYKGNFSNIYKKGTKYYSVKGISTDEAIAIREENGEYRKAIRGHKVEGN